MNGPWQYGLFVPTPEGDKPQFVITPAGVPYGWKDGQYVSVSGICSEDDARKMATAPTMLSAIEQFEAWWIAEGQKHFDSAPACVFALREAAAQARGEL